MNFALKLKYIKLLRFFHIIKKQKYNEERQIELVKQSPLFDTKWYLAQNPDVKAKKISASKHYVKHGWKEGRNPSPKFDGNKYLRENPDVSYANMCPLVHYIISGSKEGRWYSGIQNMGERIVEKGTKSGVFGAIQRALTYPIRVQAEYYQLKAELKSLKK